MTILTNSPHGSASEGTTTPDQQMCGDLGDDDDLSSPMTVPPPSLKESASLPTEPIAKLKELESKTNPPRPYSLNLKNENCSTKEMEVSDNARMAVLSSIEQEDEDDLSKLFDES